MTVIVWVTEQSWSACLDAARAAAPADADVVLLYVVGDDVPGVAHGAFTGLLGRGRPDRDPADRIARLATEAAEQLLHDAAARFGRPVRQEVRHGRVGHEVVRACAGADLLVLARDGDTHRLGPHSIGHAGRFVVDHVPCPVLLVWPGPAPDVDTIPPPPPH
ncbi:MAG TPA: universal stress protein [Pseudonocardiaceae bacterium]|nr:universal stress protein [Pseudonocardiaceae bacterium]